MDSDYASVIHAVRSSFPWKRAPQLEVDRLAKIGYRPKKRLTYMHPSYQR